MARKGLFIIFLITVLVGLLYLKPLLFKVEAEPHLVDRMPYGDFIGKLNIIELARESNALLYYNKIPFREFLSYEFLLAQGKSYGLDLQKPSYFFSNKSGEWGSLTALIDSSKILAGINRLKKDFIIEDTIVGGIKVYKSPKSGLYMTYGKLWMFIYKGNQLPKQMYHVIYSKYGDRHEVWKSFIKNTKFRNENFILFSNSKTTKDLGFSKVIFAHDADSTHLHLKAYLKSTDSLLITQKENGLSFDPKFVGNKSLDIHLNIDKIRTKLNHPFFNWVRKYSNRISFPLADFMKAWEGDIAFIEGGSHKIKETVIEMVMDDEFNLSEVKKEKEVLVPGYAVLFSMNKHQKHFVSELFAKGIMTKTDNKFRILDSPPLKINQKPNYLFLYSTDYTPKITNNHKNQGVWTYNNTRYSFNLDTIKSHEIELSIHIPFLDFLKKNKFL